MSKLSRSGIQRILCEVFVALAMPLIASAGPKHEPVVMPVSLAVETRVVTPEFLVKKIEYFIGIRVNRGLPIGQLSCMIVGKGHPSHCDAYHWNNVIDAEWKVLDGEHIVAQGTTPGYGDVAWSDSFMDRYLGQFVGEANKKYVVEVEFIKGGTPLK